MEPSRHRRCPPASKQNRSYGYSKESSTYKFNYALVWFLKSDFVDAKRNKRTNGKMKNQDKKMYFFFLSGFFFYSFE